jgi:hypothetical protein
MREQVPPACEGEKDFSSCYYFVRCNIHTMLVINFISFLIIRPDINLFFPSSVGLFSAGI